jgi:hypothetical protein
MPLAMNRRTLLPLLLGAQAFHSVARAADDSDSEIPDPEEARLSKLAGQTPKLYLPQLRDYLRQKLDVAYEIALSAAVDAEHRRAIEQAQKQWLEFYEAQRAVASYNAHGGSLAAPAAMQEGVFHLRHRIYTLVTPFLQGWTAAPYTPALKKP